MWLSTLFWKSFSFSHCTAVSYFYFFCGWILINWKLNTMPIKCSMLKRNFSETLHLLCKQNALWWVDALFFKRESYKIPLHLEVVYKLEEYMTVVQWSSPSPRGEKVPGSARGSLVRAVCVCVCALNVLSWVSSGRSGFLPQFRFSVCYKVAVGVEFGREIISC